MTDWAGTPFVRVYLTLGRDHPRVWRDLRLLGGWLRALAAAERAYPAPFELVGLPGDVIDALVAEGILENDPGDPGWYTFHGLAAARTEQATQTAWHRAGGRARAATAPRDPAGRLLAQQPAGTAGHSNGATAQQPAGLAAASPAAPAPYIHTDSVDDDDLRSSSTESLQPSSTSTPAGPAGQPPAPNGYVCRNPEAHDSPPRYVVGVGWRCPDCDAEDAAADRSSFRAKVADHGGWTPPARGADDA